MLSFIERWSFSPRAGTSLHSFLTRVVFHPYTLFLVVALAVYFPDGFNIGDINDGWIEIGTVLKADVILRGGIARTFGALPMWLGLHLDANDFRGLQILMLMFTVVRASLVYEI